MVAVSHDDKVAAAQSFLLRYCRVSVVSMGRKGCVARAAGGQVGRAEAEDVKVRLLINMPIEVQKATGGFLVTFVLYLSI